MQTWAEKSFSNKLKMIVKSYSKYPSHYQTRCRCKFRDKTDRTSWVNRNASSTGRRLSSAVSIGSENQDLMGIALSVIWEHKIKSDNIAWTKFKYTQNILKIKITESLRILNFEMLGGMSKIVYLDMLGKLLVSYLEWIPRRDHCKLQISPLYMIHSLRCNVDGRTCASIYHVGCQVYQPQLLHIFPC